MTNFDAPRPPLRAVVWRALVAAVLLAGCTYPSSSANYRDEIPSSMELVGASLGAWNDFGLSNVTVLVAADESPGNISSRLFRDEDIDFNVTMGNESWNSTRESIARVDWRAERAGLWAGAFEFSFFDTKPKPAPNVTEVRVEMMRVLRHDRAQSIESLVVLGGVTIALEPVGLTLLAEPAQQSCGDAALCSTKLNVTFSPTSSGPVYLGMITITVDNATIPDPFPTPHGPLLEDTRHTFLVHSQRLEQGPHPWSIEVRAFNGEPLAVASATVFGASS